MKYNDVVELVKSAKSIVFNKKLLNDVQLKGKADFVTAVDTSISDYLKEKLGKMYPDIGFMSEEEKSEIKPIRWILDPIDGTTNLIYNYNLSTISLALCVDEAIVFGVVYNPFNDDLFYAEKGCGAYYNGCLMDNAPDRLPSDSLIEFGAGSTRKHQAEEAFSIAKSVFCECLDLRRMCSSALAICYVSAGKLNGYFEKQLKPWDYAAASLILSECGGYCSDWDGNDISYDKPSSFVCGTKNVYDFLLEKCKK